MPMKRGYCTNCNKRDETRRIFEVNTDTKFCYCPHCGKKYRPKVAAFNYERTISKYNRRAKYFLKNVGQPTYAYNLFAYVLELESYNKTAKLGRILSLAYLSTVRRNHFGEVQELLEMAKKDVKDGKNNQKYIDFLCSLDKCVDEYMHRLKRKLTIHSYFYDVECLKLYFKHLRDSIALKRYLASDFSGSNDSKRSQAVFQSIKDLEIAYNEIIYTADGVDHSFTNFTKYGEPLITDGRKNIDTKMDKFRLSTLDKEDKKRRYIKDPVFSKTFLHMFAVYEKCILLAAISLVLGIASMIGFLIVKDQPWFAIFLTLFIIFAAQAIGLVTIYVIFGTILKKPRR